MEKKNIILTSKSHLSAKETPKEEKLISPNTIWLYSNYNNNKNDLLCFYYYYYNITNSINKYNFFIFFYNKNNDYY